MTLVLFLIAAHVSPLVLSKSALLTGIPASSNSTTKPTLPSRVAVMKLSMSFSSISALFLLYPVFHLEPFTFGQKPDTQ